jgi:hypothetical protein
MTYDFARRLDAARLDDLFNFQLDDSSAIERLALQDTGTPGHRI